MRPFTSPGHGVVVPAIMPRGGYAAIGAQLASPACLPYYDQDVISRSRRRIMKLYYHPVSTTSRPIMLFAAESGIALDFELVDLFKGEHLGEAYCRINPNGQVPVLEDGDFRLTEGATILRYLAD